jgi:hypothetical protein
MTKNDLKQLIREIIEQKLNEGVPRFFPGKDLSGIPGGEHPDAVDAGDERLHPRVIPPEALRSDEITPDYLKNPKLLKLLALKGELTDKERDVINFRYGSPTTELSTLENTAIEMSRKYERRFGKEEIRRIEVKALRNLRKGLMKLNSVERSAFDIDDMNFY